MKRTLVLLGVLLVGTIFSVNVLTDDELHNLVDSVNVIRSLEPATLPTLTIDANLSALAVDWTNKCSFTADRKLKWLYSNVWIKTDKNATAFDVADAWGTESVNIVQFKPFELSKAMNWSSITWLTSTKIGCAASACGDSVMWGCLLSPKGGFPGLMPFIPTCVADKKIDCAKLGNCGQYNDGCKTVVCGPACNSSGQSYDNIPSVPSVSGGKHYNINNKQPVAPAPVSDYAGPVGDASTGSNASPSQVDEILSVHNRERAAVCVSNINWDPSIAAIAQSWANGCSFQHSMRQGYGENIASGSSGYSMTDLTNLWANEKSSYSCRSCCSGGTGHYTQSMH